MCRDSCTGNLFSQRAKTFTFPDISSEAKQKLVETLLQRLESAAGAKCHAACLETIRILSRDKNGLDVMTSDKALLLFAHRAGLDNYTNDSNGPVTLQDTNGLF